MKIGPLRTQLGDRPLPWLVLLVLPLVLQGAGCERAVDEGRAPQSPQNDGGAGSNAMGFRVPDAKARKAAIGDLQPLPKPLRRAFADNPDVFSPIPAPGPADWLANHKENGQSFAEYVESGANPVEAPRTRLTIQPIDDFAAHPTAPRMDDLVAYATIYFGMETRANPAVAAKDIGARTRINNHSGKRQIRSTDVLDWLAKRVPDDTYASVALTMIDLYPQESWNFVFGQASLSERSGVYSFARYDPAFYGEKRGKDVRKLVLRRALKVMVHETGHMFGMQHCVHFSCVMNGSNHLDESDSREIHLCPVCLRKLHHAVGFDPVTRYEKLGKYYRDHEMDKEAAWIDKRLSALR